MAAAVVSSWLLNVNVGPLHWIIEKFSSGSSLKIVLAVLVVAVGAALTYGAWRVAEKSGGAASARSADEALNDLDAMVGLGPVKEEVNKLLAGLEVEKKRREQGMPVGTISRHMVFTGPPGVGKTQVARALGEIYRSLNVLRKGHLVETDRAGLVAGYSRTNGQARRSTCANPPSTGSSSSTKPMRWQALRAPPGHDFGREAIETLLKFMEDNRDRIVVIAAGYPNEMRHSYPEPGLPAAHQNHRFPALSDGRACAILRGMAKSQKYELPNELEVKLRPWIERERKRDDWGNARQMDPAREGA